MTLAVFLMEHPQFKIKVHSSYKHKWAVIDATDTARGQLFQLDDYRVSSVSKGMIWLKEKACQ